MNGEKTRCMACGEIRMAHRLEWYGTRKERLCRDGKGVFRYPTHPRRASLSLSADEAAVADELLRTLLRGGDPRALVRHKALGGLVQKFARARKRIELNKAKRLLQDTGTES